MTKIVTLDTIEIQGVNLWLEEGKPLVEANYGVVASDTEGVHVSKSREVTELLSQEDQAALVGILGRLKAALEQEELG